VLLVDRDRARQQRATECVGQPGREITAVSGRREEHESFIAYDAGESTRPRARCQRSEFRAPHFDSGDELLRRCLGARPAQQRPSARFGNAFVGTGW
jgi:hypothetical protein